MSRIPAGVPSSIGIVIRPSEAISPDVANRACRRSIRDSRGDRPPSCRRSSWPGSEVGPVVLGKEPAGPADDRPRAAAATSPAAVPVRIAAPTDFGRNPPLAVDRAVGEVADQGLLLAVAQPGDGQDRARVGRDGRAQVAVDREPQGHVVFRLDVLDPRAAMAACSR